MKTRAAEAKPTKPKKPAKPTKPSKPTESAKTAAPAKIAFIGGPRVLKAMRNLKPFFGELHGDAKRQLARIA